MPTDYNTLHVIDHPLARHHLSVLRDRHTTPDAFRHHVRALSVMLAIEATRDLAEVPITVETPIEPTNGSRLAGRIALVPILRAGLGMVPAVTDLIPGAEVWHLGIFRDEQTALPVAYYDKLPNENPPEVAFLLDPMLATGGSAVAALESLTRWRVQNVVMLSLIAAPEGIRQLTNRFPNVGIYTCAADRELNERRFIVPGLGDAGDRIFNT